MIHNSPLLQQGSIAFQKIYQQPATIYGYAPGRVNIIGEHTDYNGGFCLPAAIDFGVLILGTPRDDSKVIAHSHSFPQAAEFDLSQTLSPETSPTGWAAYLVGVTDYLQQASGKFAKGANLYLIGDLPLGAGLSSSAALEMAMAHYWIAQQQLTIDPVKVALIGQQVEHNYLGCKCGNMDQLASNFGVAQSCLLLDCRSLEITPVSLPEQHSLLIINSNIKHNLVESQYNQRVIDCNKAAAYFKVPLLRDVSLTEFNQAVQEQTIVEELGAITVARAKHIITENQRVLDTVQAIKNNDITQISQLMDQSHQSMKDDFAITIDEIDGLQQLGQEFLAGRGGIRMTGGGFGGCLVALVPNNLVTELQQYITQHYKKVTAVAPSFYSCQPSAGAIHGLLSANL